MAFVAPYAIRIEGSTASSVILYSSLGHPNQRVTISVSSQGMQIARAQLASLLLHPKSVYRMRHFDDISKVPFPPFILPLLARIFSLTGKNFFPDWENDFL